MQKLKEIVNIVDGYPITLEESLNSSYLFLKYKIGNQNTDVLLNLISRDKIKPVSDTLQSSLYYSINMDLIALELDLKYVDVINSILRLTDLGFIKGVIGKELGFTNYSISIEPDVITKFIKTNVEEVVKTLVSDGDILGVEVKSRARTTNDNSNKETGLWVDLHIKYASDLSSDEKIILSDIIVLHNTTAEGVYKGNKSFSKLINKSIPTVKRVIKSLKKKGYLKDENRLVYSNPTTVQKRYLIPTFFAITGKEEYRFDNESITIDTDEKEVTETEPKLKETDKGYLTIPF